MALDFVDYDKIREQTKVSKMKCIIENYRITEGSTQKLTKEMKEMKI